MKVAIVHDWINSFAGAIRVAHNLWEMYPDAPIYTSVYDEKKVPQFKGADIRTSKIQTMPFGTTKHQLFPLMRQKAFEKFDFSEYDLVISSSGSEAKGIITGDNTLHINYCHAPTHYYWRNYKEYLEDPGFGPLNPIAKLGLRVWVRKARKWDKKAAQRPDHIIVNSTFIQAEVKKYYERDSTVIHPPVDINRFVTTGKEERHGFLIVGRQVPFKRFHLAVKACSDLGLPLTVAGNGSENKRLRAMAGPSVTFKTNVTDEELNHLFTHAEGFIFPSEDDFGIVAAEAQSAGTPVIAFASGGSIDIVEDGKTGVFFEGANAESLKSALEKFQTIEWNAKAIQKSAQRFSKQRFEREMRKFVDQKYVEFQQNQPTT